MMRVIKSNNKIFLLFFISFVLFFNTISSPIIADDTLLPDLIPNYVYAPQSPWPAEEEVEIIIKVKNVGTKNISVGEVIEVGLFIDNDETPISTSRTAQGLDIGKTCFVNITYTQLIGDGEEHTLTIFVNYNQIIEELSYSNNYWQFKVIFAEKETELKIIDIDVPYNLLVGETADITATIKNNGQSTNKIINAKLNSSEDGEVQTLVYKYGLDKNEVLDFNFRWTPSHFGNQIISVDVLLVNKTHDFKEITVNVGVGKLEWWNENWHYRYFLSINGSGNVAKLFNFTELLEELDVSGSFENDTIRIIQYSNDGTIEDEVELYKFNESTGFDSLNNAVGTLIWAVSEDPQEKFYSIFFDVEINPGIRIPIEETDTLEEYGDAITESGFIDGWKIEIKEPINEGYTLILDPINISVVTDAKAKEVTALVFLKDNISHNFTLNLVDIETQTNWMYNDFYFDNEGSWIIRVTSLDDAGYNPLIVEHNLLVGKPDIKLINFSISTEGTPSSTFYRNSTITIVANIVNYDATIEDVKISLKINKLPSNQQIFLENITITLIKAVIINVSFDWFANESGKFNIFISIDPDNEVDESNENNNMANIPVIIQEWPDLTVQSIILPSVTVMEFEKVKIDVAVKNQGFGNASDYKIKLYIEEYFEDDLGFMKFLEEKDNETISIDANSTESVSMYWNSAEAGIWMVGVNIIVEAGQRDSNFLNNYKLSEKNLVIKSYDSNNPVISIFMIEPKNQEQGGAVTIFANITDDSGLEFVKIKFIDPLNVTYNWTNMVRNELDIFKKTFINTIVTGIYKFEIKAVDISIHSNTEIYEGNFTIYQDKTYPVISYFEAQPKVQLKNNYVEFLCIATDNIGILSAKVIITNPEDMYYEDIMSYSNGGKYVYSDKYNITGKYEFEIEVTDKSGKKTSKDATFWITTDLNDTDNDGIQDRWEIKYGLDPYNPNDADDDPDKDGLINLEEYKFRTDPLKYILGENVEARLKDNAWYLAGSIALFCLSLILSIYGKRRKLK